MSTLKIISIALFLAAIPVGATSGQSTAAAAASAPTPCVNAPERHQFDFWLGEWDVKTKDGSPAGTSVIQSVSGGCALLENWTSARGGNGKSLNAYNPALKQWQQYWIGQDGVVTEFSTSTYDGRSLTFLTKNDAKLDSLSRMAFTPVDSASVRQHVETSADHGKSWTTTYDLYYHRKRKQD
jgi:hypothetical protein